MKFLRIAFKSLVFLFCSMIVIMIGLYVYAYMSPKLELKTANQFYIYDNNKDLIYQGSGNSEWVNIEDISDNLLDAVVSVEDKNFYKHQGFDYLRIAKAMLVNIKSKSIKQGASTISQQYIKNMYLDFGKTWKRKIEEAFLTLELEVHYDKEDILEGYLNTINYGQGNYGVESASNYYFNKKPSELTLEEACILAGIPKNPTKYNPISNYDESIKRAKIVAKSMVNNEYITQEEYDNLFQNKIEIYGKSKENNLQMLMYYQDAVLDELESIHSIPASLIESGGLKIYTNLNLDAQTSLEENILEYTKDTPDIQVASVLVDPNTGDIIALSGGLDYAKSQYNRATKSSRQVGSTMKSFLYYTALENGLVSSSTFSSEPTTFNLSNNKSYSPTNYGARYANKDITMAAAIAMSDNIYAVKTNLFLGTEKLVETAKKVGIKKELPENPSLALGTTELNILDYATGYTTLASGGYKKDLHLIKKVEDLEGNTLYEAEDDSKLVLNENYVYILNEMLTSTTNAAFIDYSKPTALTISSKLTKKYAIKTGSTNTDFWSIGYNKDLLMLVWVGYDDNRSVNVNQSYISKNIWADTMEDVLKDKEDNWYEKPSNVEGAVLNAITGEPTNDNKNATLFYFVRGSYYDNTQIVSKEKESSLSE
ncbi:MAG: penicillin-binding protein [Bacilli bacterium]|nr:penicillin-binding protein [Bacilli bacterium]